MIGCSDWLIVVRDVSQFHNGADGFMLPLGLVAICIKVDRSLSLLLLLVDHIPVSLLQC